MYKLRPSLDMNDHKCTTVRNLNTYRTDNICRNLSPPDEKTLSIYNFSLD